MTWGVNAPPFPNPAAFALIATSYLECVVMPDVHTTVDSPIRVSPFLSVIFMIPILQQEFDTGSFLQISITASRQQRVSAILIVTIPTHQSSEKRTKGNNRHLYIVVCYQLIMAQSPNQNLDQTIMACHNPNCLTTDLVDDRTRDWFINDWMHCCSEPCLEIVETLCFTGEMSPPTTICDCKHCVQHHDSYTLHGETTPAIHFEPEMPGVCVVVDCIVCKVRETPVIPTIDCGNPFHPPLTLSADGCTDCFMDELVYDLHLANRDPLPSLPRLIWAYPNYPWGFRA